jgi:protocatechuate 3,4-dioxygenase beta subunit
MAKHDHDGGLAKDLELMERRRALGLIGSFFGAVALVPVFGCTGGAATDSGSASSSSSSSGGTSSSSSSSTSSGATGTCSKIPEETGGPYPGDGTNGVNALTQSGIVRSDVRPSFGSYTGTAEGVVMTLTFTVIDPTNGCAPIAGYAVYMWHCDRDGNYSLYTAKNANYLRGVQVTDAKGQVTFTSIFPACYSGRWPHIHFEVYPSVATATEGQNAVATSQIALPETTCNQVFAVAGYETSVTNLKQVSLSTDMVFSDGVSLETPTISGDVTSGINVSLTVAV